MNKIINISSFKQISTMVLGVLIAILLGAGQVNVYYQHVEKQAVEHEGQDGEDSATEVLVISAVDAIAASVQSLISHVFYFISENIVSVEQDTDSNYFEKPFFETYLNTIFRQIISPNAP